MFRADIQMAEEQDQILDLGRKLTQMGHEQGSAWEFRYGAHGWFVVGIVCYNPKVAQIVLAYC